MLYGINCSKPNVLILGSNHTRRIWSDPNRTFLFSGPTINKAHMRSSKPNVFILGPNHTRRMWRDPNQTCFFSGPREMWEGFPCGHGEPVVDHGPTLPTDLDQQSKHPKSVLVLAISTKRTFSRQIATEFATKRTCFSCQTWLIFCFFYKLGRRDGKLPRCGSTSLQSPAGWHLQILHGHWGQPGMGLLPKMGPQDGPPSRCLGSIFINKPRQLNPPNSFQSHCK